MKRLNWKSFVIVNVMALLGLILFTSLGNWQMQRSQEKSALLTDYNTRINSKLTIADNTSRLDNLEIYSPVSLTGSWAASESFLLDNKHKNSQVGVWVFTPFIMNDGAVVVNRGFVPLSLDRLISPDHMHKILTIDDGSDASIDGIKWTLPQAALSGEPVIDDKLGIPLWSNITPAKLDVEWRQAGVQLTTDYVVVLDNDNPASFGIDLEPSNSNFGPNKHIAYAIQWYSFVLIIIILLGAYWWHYWRIYRVQRNA